MRRLGIALLACAVSACATVETRPLGLSQPSGIAYQLPLGKMRLRVVETAGIVSVLLDGPLVTGDPDHQLVAHLPQSGVADNNVTVTVDGKTNRSLQTLKSRRHCSRLTPSKAQIREK